MSLESLKTPEVGNKNSGKTQRLKKQVCDTTIDILEIDPKVEVIKLIKSGKFELLKGDKDRYFDPKNMVYIHDYKLQDLENEENIISFQIVFSSNNNKVFGLNYKNKTTSFVGDDLFKLVKNIYPKPVYLADNNGDLELTQVKGYKFMNQ